MSTDPRGEERALARSAWPVRAAAGLVIIAHLVLLVMTARQKSVTSDEPFHIGRGVAALFRGDFRISVAHPPLVNMICALPLRAMPGVQAPPMDEVMNNPRIDPEEKKLYYSMLFLWARDYGTWAGNRDPLRIIFWCRVPVMLMSAALGLLIFSWAGRMFGPAAGMAGLALYCFSPTVLAHAMLCTTDIGSALFIFIFALALDRHLAGPSWKTLLLCGLTFGLAQLTKFTAVLLIPLTPLVLFLVRPGTVGARVKEFFSPCPGRPGFLTGAWACGMMFVAGAVVIWAGYGFELHSPYRIEAMALPALSSPALFVKYLALKLMAAVTVPPGTYYFGLSRTIRDTSEHFHPLYFLGRVAEQGWWYYYPVLFAIKEPLSLLGLIALAMAAVRRPPRLTRAVAAIALVLAAGMALFFMFFNQKNIGIRHLLPVYPFLFLWLSRLASVRGPRRVLPYGAWALIAAYTANAFISYPDYLVHFNSLAGGPDGGLSYSVVGEDWGQDIMALGKFCREQGITSINYNAYGNADARAYGVPAHKFDCTDAQPGWYAIHVVDLLRPRKDQPADCYARFKAMTPAAVLHHTISVYYVKPGG